MGSPCQLSNKSFALGSFLSIATTQTSPVISSHVARETLVLHFCICFDCKIKYVYTKDIMSKKGSDFGRSAIWLRSIRSKHTTSTYYRIKTGPSSTTLSQDRPIDISMSCVVEFNQSPSSFTVKKQCCKALRNGIAIPAVRIGGHCVH